MHVPGFSANECLIHFNFAAELSASTFILHRKAYALKHEPSGLLADSGSTANLVTTYSVLTVPEHPHSQKPLIQRNRGVLEDCSYLDAELRLRMARSALPESSRSKERYFPRAASWANRYTVFPATLCKVTNAIVGISEANDCVLESCWSACHECSMGQVA
jgi:hypothetical protein